ncbi:MAG: response regulator transcription factor [Chloroflexi bacterium]|nr:response regulator transcription factor [Chloroflexota bacterium]
MLKTHRASASSSRTARGLRAARSTSSIEPSEQLSTTPVRVVVALMHAPLCERVTACLGRNGVFAVVGSQADRAPAPDVVILDFMPGTGIPAIHGVSSARTIALSSAADDEAYLCALREGAWALLPSRPSPFEVTAVVRQVAAGECPILAQIARRPTLAATALGRLRAAAAHPNPLSAREAAILSQVAKGAKNGVIGAILGLREQTVKNYLSEILKKTGTGNRAEAAAMAVRHSWVEAD